MTVLGGGFLSDRVPGWIRKNGLEERVDYRGQVSWQEVKNQYLKSDLFIFTSLRDSFGSQLLEAMAYGLPIITLNHQGARDFVPEGCSIKVPVVDPKETINALARAVEYLYGNPEKRLEMGRIGYEFALNQTWLKKALKISEYYEEIVSKKY
jgi:glycosyltransferase involved in cell wall biosynthesis